MATVNEPSHEALGLVGAQPFVRLYSAKEMVLTQTRRQALDFRRLAPEAGIFLGQLCHGGCATPRRVAMAGQAALFEREIHAGLDRHAHEHSQQEGSERGGCWPGAWVRH